MEEIQVLIATTHQEGDFICAWFSLPISEDDLFDQFGERKAGAGYVVLDHAFPFALPEDTSIEKINRLHALLGELPEPVVGELKSLLPYFSGLEELHSRQDDIIHYPGCEDIEDVARCYIEVNGLESQIPETLRQYRPDYEALARSLEMTRTFVFTSCGAFEIRS